MTQERTLAGAGLAKDCHVHRAPRGVERLVPAGRVSVRHPESEIECAACGGNQTEAAALLGMSRRTLISRIAEYGLPRPRKRSEAGD